MPYISGYLKYSKHWLRFIEVSKGFWYVSLSLWLSEFFSFFWKINLLLKWPLLFIFGCTFYLHGTIRKTDSTGVQGGRLEMNSTYFASQKYHLHMSFRKRTFLKFCFGEMID